MKPRPPWGNTARLAFGLAWAAVVVAPADADENPEGAGRVALEINTCSAVPIESVRRILSIEIGDLLLDDGERVPAGADRLTIRCAGNSAWVEAAGQGGGMPIERTFRLDGFPGDAAPRALALLGLELLAAHSATVRERILSRRTMTPPAVATTAAPPSPVASAREVRIGLAGIWRTFIVRDGISVLGGQVRANSTVGRIGTIAADAEIAGGQNDVTGMGQTTALLISGAGSIGLHGANGNLGASIDVGGRFGAVRLSGSSTDPVNITGATVWHPWGGPVMAASVSSRLGLFALSLGVEAGWSVFRSDGLAGPVTAISIGGPWVALFFGGGVCL